MALSQTFIKLLEHPVLSAIARLIQKFRHSKSYWSVISLVLVFIVREALAANYGEAIKTFMTAQAEGSDHAWFWNVLGFILGEGGSWGLVALGILLFIVLSLVKVSENKNGDTQYKETEKAQTITHSKLDELTALVSKLQNGDETAFLTKYFGNDYAVILENPKTYHNFTTLLTHSTKTADELLKERETLLEKIVSQAFSQTLQQQIDKAFSELRYDDARALIDAFLEANHNTEQALIKAHYIKALSYMEQIRYQDAKKEFETIGPSIDDAKILLDYANMYDTLGEYDKAITFYDKALKIRLATLGENHPTTATIYNNIGLAWGSKGEYDKAIDFHEKALKIRLATLGENHPDTATSYNNIGAAWTSKGEYDKAISFYEKALKITLTTLGENHPDTATIYNNIGLAWTSKGEYDKAIAFYEKALKIILTTLGENHPDTATSYNNIGSAWNRKGEYDKAISFYEKALKINLATLGENHPAIAISYNNIGLAWDSKGKYDKAITFYEKALKINLATLGENHPDTATSYNNISLAWDSKGEYDKAISFYNKALKIRLATLGENHPDTATSYNNIGLASYRKDEYDNAIIYFEKALKILRVSFPTGHPNIDITEDSLRIAKETLRKISK